MDVHCSTVDGGGESVSRKWIVLNGGGIRAKQNPAAPHPQLSTKSR